MPKVFLLATGEQEEAQTGTLGAEEILGRGGKSFSVKGGAMTNGDE